MDGGEKGNRRLELDEYELHRIRRTLNFIFDFLYFWRHKSFYMIIAIGSCNFSSSLIGLIPW